MLDSGIIKPSSSPYNSPLWTVPKKMDTPGKQKWRLVSDFRLLNDKTISNAYPLPSITQIIDQVGGYKYYTTLDLAKGFQKILMEPRDAHKTAFSIPHGHYEYVRMTFGLKNAPPTVERFIDVTFKNLQGKILFTFIDNIVVFADSLEEHDKKMKLIMDRLRASNLQLNPDKFEFLQDKVCYLKHMLNKKDVSPDPRKLEAGRDFPKPKNVKNIRQFLGLAEFYRRFIKNFAQITKPLSKLLQKDIEFKCNPPILQYPDFSKPFNIKTDASEYAISGILSQGEIGKDLPIAYTSRVLRDPQLSYEVYEKETLAMIHVVKIFHSYIYGKKINIITDHQPLVWFKTAKLNTRVQKWRFKLSEFDYKVIYKPGKSNLNADALSRNPTEPVPTQFYNVITRNQKKKEETNNILTDKKRTSKRMIEKPTPNYVESESSYSTNPKAKTALPPDKISSKLISPKIEGDMEDIVKMTDSNPEEEALIQQKEN